MAKRPGPRAGPARWIVAALLLISAALAAYAASAWLYIETDASKTVRGGSPAFTRFTDLEDRFGMPSEDEVLVVSAADLGSADAFLALEDLVVELQLSPSVRGVISIFSITGPDGAPLLAAPDYTDLEPGERLDRLRAESAIAQRFLAEDRGTTLVLVLPDLALAEPQRITELNDVIETAGGPIEVQLLGLPALNREVSAAIVSDLAFFVPLGAVLCLLVAALLFRSPRALVVCAVAPALSITWTVGIVALTGTAFTPMVTLVPVVIITLGIADSVHVYHAILARLNEGQDLSAAIATGMRETMPAVAVTSGTTAAAFLSVLVVGSETLRTLAWVGSLGLFLTFVALNLSMPLIVRAMHRSNGGTHVDPGVSAAENVAFALFARPRLMRGIAAGLLGLLLIVQTFTERGFDVMEFVPHRSEFRTALDQLEAAVPGSNQSYVVIEGTDGTPTLSDAEADRIGAVAEAVFGEGADFPLDAAQMETSDALTARFVARDGSGFALPVPGPLSVDWRETLARSTEIEASLDAAGLSDVTHVTGYTHMLSIELPMIVSQLRTAFYLAVGIITLATIILMRSVMLAIAALIPNIIPILGAEAWLVLTGATLTLVEAVALTIAFGIAVDDTTHILNRIRLAMRRAGTSVNEAVVQALREATRPIVATSLILLAGFGAASLSTLPSVSSFCQLAAIATALALLADLALLPSLVTAFWRR